MRINEHVGAIPVVGNEEIINFLSHMGNLFNNFHGYTSSVYPKDMCFEVREGSRVKFATTKKIEDFRFFSDLMNHSTEMLSLLLGGNK